MAQGPADGAEGRRGGVLKFASNQKKQILSWVLGFGTAVKVLAPESLKAEVIESAKKVIGRYEG